MPKGKWVPLTKKQENLIKKHYLDTPIKRLAKEIGTTNGVIMRKLKLWGLTIPRDVVEANKAGSFYQKGRIPDNKGKKQTEYMSKEAIERTKNTRFKKGSKPHNTKYDGYERITEDGYISVRVEMGVYRLKHIVEWEKVNGLVPEGDCLKCLDDNRLNTDPANWKLISRIENMLNNSPHKYPDEFIPTLVLTNKINNKLKNLENGKK